MKNIIPIFLLVFFVSCDLINPGEQIPAYLKIEKIQLDASPNFSSNSENIIDAWVYVNDNLVGAFEMPFEIPILAEGTTEIRIIPGIYKDGIKSHHHFYGYYTFFDTIINCNPEETTTISPTVFYNDAGTTFLNEDFEGIDLQLEASTNSDYVLEVTDNIAIDGLKTGYLLADAADKTMGIVTKNEFQVLNRGILPTYFELDYISTVEFSVGIITESGIENYELKLRPTSTRKKIYVDLSTEIAAFSKTTKYKVSIEGISTKSGDYIAIDNVRLLIPN